MYVFVESPGKERPEYYKGILMQEQYLSCLLGIAEPDEPVYRIFPFRLLEEVFRAKQLILAAPQLWEDPYGLLAHEVVSDNSGVPWGQVFLEHHLKPAFVQAWSSTAEFHVLQQAYSKDPSCYLDICVRDEGVRVKSTPAKLIGAMRSWCPVKDGQTCFVGAAKYRPRVKVLQEIADRLAEEGAESLTTGRARAEFMLLKRHEYAYEAEVLMLYIEERNVAARDVVRVSFEPDDTFDDIAFDPRLPDFEKKKRETLIHTMGYTGTVSAHDRYQENSSMAYHL